MKYRIPFSDYSHYFWTSFIRSLAFIFLYLCPFLSLKFLNIYWLLVTVVMCSKITYSLWIIALLPAARFDYCQWLVFTICVEIKRVVAQQCHFKMKCYVNAGLSCWDAVGTKIGSPTRTWGKPKLKEGVLFSLLRPLISMLRSFICFCVICVYFDYFLTFW